MVSLPKVSFINIVVFEYYSIQRELSHPGEIIPSYSS